MASRSLSFLLFGEDVTAGRAFRKVAAEAEAADASVKGAFSKGSLLGVGVLVAGLGLAAKGAADFQTQMTRLVTAGGESQKNLALVSKGVMDISTATGTSLKATGDAMYWVESAGYHGKQGLDVLKAAAQGAKIEGVDTAKVADALTTSLNDLGKKAGPPAVVMSQLVATVARGKTTMDLLSGSLHSVLPNASALGISFAEVAGAIATMTSQGVSAEQTTQNLNHVIVSLANPTGVMTSAMAAFGIKSTQVMHDLGRQGLTGTLTELSQAAIDHMGPAGLTISKALNSSQIAAGKVTEAYKAMTPEMQKYADEVAKGGHATVTARQLGQGFDLAQKTQIQQYERLYKAAHGFSDLLKAKSPDALTYVAAMAKMTGGIQGVQVALHLTGDNMPIFKDNVAAIGKATSEAGGNVKDFATQQQTLNGKIADLRVSASNLGVQLGTQLVPALTAAADWTLKHKAAVEVLVGGLIGLKVVLGAIKLAQEAWTAATIIGAGVQKALGLASSVTAGQVAVETAALDTQTGSLSAQRLAGFSATAQTTALGGAAATSATKTAGLTAAAGLASKALGVAGIALAAEQAWSAFHHYAEGVANGNSVTDNFIKFLDSSNVATTFSNLWGMLNNSGSHADAAAAKIAAVGTSVRQLPSGKTILINTQYNSYGLDQFIQQYQYAASLPPISNKLPGAPQLPAIPGAHATGGDITGPGTGTSDSIPAMLSNGEYVIKATVAKHYHGLLDAINNGGAPVAHFAKGGRVGHGLNAASQQYLAGNTGELGTGFRIDLDLGRLIAGALGSPASVAAKLTTLLRDVYQAVVKGMAPPPLIGILQRENAQFAAIGAARQHAAAEIKIGNANLASAQKAFDVLVDKVSGGVTNSFGLTSIGTDTNAAQVIRDLQNNVAQAGQFANNLKLLKDKGFNQDLLSQIGMAGVSGGGATASALANASKGDLATIAALWAKDNQYGNLAGQQVAANSPEGAGVRSATAFLKGWGRVEAALDAQAKRLAAKMAAQVAANVHITINAGMGANGAALGREIARELEAYLGNGGKVKGL